MRVTVRITPNFEANLVQIENYWDDNEFPAGFDQLINELTQTTLPTLEQYPRLGRAFMQRVPLTAQAKRKMQSLAKQLAKFGPEAEIREYVLADYTLLYLLTQKAIDLLSIKHHKQLAYSLTKLNR